MESWLGYAPLLRGKFCFNADVAAAERREIDAADGIGGRRRRDDGIALELRRIEIEHGG